MTIHVFRAIEIKIRFSLAFQRTVNRLKERGKGSRHSVALTFFQLAFCTISYDSRNLTLIRKKKSLNEIKRFG